MAEADEKRNIFEGTTLINPSVLNLKKGGNGGDLILGACEGVDQSTTGYCGECSCSFDLTGEGDADMVICTSDGPACQQACPCNQIDACSTDACSETCMCDGVDSYICASNVCANDACLDAPSIHYYYYWLGFCVYPLGYTDDNLYSTYELADIATGKDTNSDSYTSSIDTDQEGHSVLVCWKSGRTQTTNTLPIDPGMVYATVSAPGHVSATSVSVLTTYYTGDTLSVAVRPLWNRFLPMEIVYLQQNSYFVYTNVEYSDDEQSDLFGGGERYPLSLVKVTGTIDSKTESGYTGKNGFVRILSSADTDTMTVSCSRNGFGMRSAVVQKNVDKEITMIPDTTIANTSMIYDMYSGFTNATSFAVATSSGAQPAIGNIVNRGVEFNPHAGKYRALRLGDIYAFSAEPSYYRDDANKLYNVVKWYAFLTDKYYNVSCPDGQTSTDGGLDEYQISIAPQPNIDNSYDGKKIVFEFPELDLSELNLSTDGAARSQTWVTIHVGMSVYNGGTSLVRSATAVTMNGDNIPDDYVFSIGVRPVVFQKQNGIDDFTVKVDIYVEIGGTGSGTSTLNFTYSIPNTQCIYLIGEE
jgi:hypothetical protein